MEKNFKKRIEDFNKLHSTYKGKSDFLSVIRVITFFLFLIIFIYLLKSGIIVLSFFILIILLFGFSLIVNYHHSIRNNLEFYQNLIEINELEIQRLNLDLQAFDNGERYLKEDHPYAYDLDIFGRHSIYQLISRCTTLFGKDQLAADLNKHHKPETIYSKQLAVKELTHKIDWRQSLHAYGKINSKTESKNLDLFLNWIHSEKKSKHLSVFAILTVILWILFICTMFFIIIGKISFLWMFSFNLIAFVLLAPRIKIVQQLTIALTGINKQFSAISKIINLIEKEHFDSQLLNELKKEFVFQNYTASSKIKKLTSIVDLLQNRGNPFYLILNSFFAFDIIFLYQAEKWREGNKHHLETWLKTVGEFEILLSYSAYAFANPDYHFPEIIEDKVSLLSENTGHPLIHPKHRVVNNFKIEGKGAVDLITGSNMAGKSTFLRTIGVNLVLAQCGAPACASKFMCYPFKVFSSMRTKDNLMESVSTFYAELIRIKSLLNQLDEETTTFYLLDEILKGTNSHDRHLGAINLIKQLNESNAVGLVSTHDVELNELTDKIENMENYSFHSNMVNDQLQFDYKLKKGPCNSFNAIQLMKKMGISMD